MIVISHVGAWRVRKPAVHVRQGRRHDVFRKSQTQPNEFKTSIFAVHRQHETPNAVFANGKYTARAVEIQSSVFSRLPLERDICYWRSRVDLSPVGLKKRRRGLTSKTAEYGDRGAIWIHFTLPRDNDSKFRQNQFLSVQLHRYVPSEGKILLVLTWLKYFFL